MGKIFNVKKKKKSEKTYSFTDDDDNIRLRPVEDVVWDEFKHAVKVIKKQEKIKRNLIRKDLFIDVLNKDDE